MKSTCEEMVPVKEQDYEIGKLIAIRGDMEHGKKIKN
jgi:hypothetical protein